MGHLEEPIASSKSTQKVNHFLHIEERLGQ